MNQKRGFPFLFFFLVNTHITTTDPGKSIHHATTLDGHLKHTHHSHKGDTPHSPPWMKEIHYCNFRRWDHSTRCHSKSPLSGNFTWLHLSGFPQPSHAKREETSTTNFFFYTASTHLMSTGRNSELKSTQPTSIQGSTQPRHIPSMRSVSIFNFCLKSWNFSLSLWFICFGLKS